MPKAGWKSPNNQWDRHSRPQARAALAAARKAGWWLKKSSGSAKVWGVITCGDPDLPRTERCSTSVLSTSGSADGSETAEHINNQVRSCTHERTATAGADVLGEAQNLVASASRCLDAARSLIEAKAHRDLVEDYLEQVESAANEADNLLAEALAEDDKANVAEAAASASAGAAGASTSVGWASLAEQAHDQAGEAKGLVSGESSREARLLKGRCDDCRRRLKTDPLAAGQIGPPC